MLIGAYVGAIVSLMVFARSKNYYIPAITETPLLRSINSFASLADGRTLSTPTNLSQKALWVRLAANKLNSHRQLSPAEYSTVLGLAREGFILEPENGYWSQMMAAITQQESPDATPIELWRRASLSTAWNDHQGDLTDKVFYDKQLLPGYVYARLFLAKSSASETLIDRECERMLANNWNSSSGSTLAKLVALKVGDTMRKHSKSIVGMDAAIRLIDSTLLEPGLVPEERHHALLLARIALAKEISSKNLGMGSDEVEHIFRESDGAFALTTEVDTAAYEERLALLAAVLGVLPGALMLSSLAALLVYLVSRLHQAMLSLNRKSSSVGTIVFAVLAGLGSIALAPLWAGLTLFSSILFTSLNPNHIRLAKVDTLGPLFGSWMTVIALAVVGIATSAFAIHSPAVGILLQHALPATFDWRSSTAGLFALMLSTLFVSGPLWAYAQRIPTERVVAIGFNQLVVNILLFSLVLAVVSIPAVIYFDLRTATTLRQLVANEPLYFLIR